MKLIAKLKTAYLQTRIVFATDVLVSTIASLMVLILPLLLLNNNPYSGNFLYIWAIGAFISSCLSFRIGQVYRYIIRYSSLRELSRICIVSLGKDILLGVIVACFTQYNVFHEFFWALLILDFFVTMCAMMLVRMAMVVAYDIIQKYARMRGGVKRILVFGTGDKSVSAAIRLRHSSHYEVVGFITHDKDLSKHSLQGLQVFLINKAEDFASVAHQRRDVDGVLFAYTNDARAEKDNLIVLCRKAGLKVYLAPGIDEVKEGDTLNIIRKLNIEDLLGRPEIELSMDKISGEFNGKTIMVTGAAGSIGSELCRQLARLDVKELLLFDNAETPLHSIRLELEEKFPELKFVPIIGDVRNLLRLDFVFRKYRPDVVFHAAAYKHVPLMEENPCEAVRVNVIGTQNVADKCLEYDTSKMVMISTDKAVNPTNVMGCSKRLAEIYVQSLGLAMQSGQIKGVTKFVTTRFGNVLGSNGSVIPRFTEQIAHGGPITVTHPEIRRFFMTIPEACRLVMEAATMTSGNQIFAFDMGEPVKIADLAKQMIHLAGLELGKDIEIEYTGLRPGEKLYEEVLASKEDTIATEHSRIYVAKVREYNYSNVCGVFNQLEKYAVEVHIPEMIKLMKATVPEFISKNSEFEKYDKAD